MKDYVVFYGPTDGASRDELRNAEKVIQSFNADTEYTDINRVIELYNIKQYFDNEMYLTSWNESTKNKYIDIVKKFDSVIGKYFSRVLGENIYQYFESINVHYHYVFWEIIDCFGVYKRITSEQFTAMIKKDHVLVYILHCPKIVRKFGNEIAKELTINIEYAETVLNYYIAKHTRTPKRKVYIPSELTAENKKSILKNYIEWERANPNYLHLISTFKKSDDFATDDRIRYAAHKKYQEYWHNEANTRNVVWHKYGASVSFYDDSQDRERPVNSECEENTLELAYGTSWIKENLDYPTLLNNFIYLFGFVDEQFRYQHLANPAKLGVLERAFGVSGRNDYKTGIDYQVRRISSIGQMTGYLKQLELNNIKLENIFKWFFETYLDDEFDAKGFQYFVPSETASWLEKILVLISQFDSVIKQFRIFIEDKKIDRDFLEFSSDYYKLSDTPSMIAKKYIYPKSDRINSAMYMFFSDQSLLYYVDGENKYNNLPHMLLERHMKVSDFEEYNQRDIKWLIKEGFALVDDQQYVKINTEVAYLLNDFFQNGVISYSYYKNRIPFMVNQIDTWLELGDIESKQSLFTTQEQEFIDYMLNVQKYDNGPELRNKYAHGIFPVDPKKQEQDYIELLRIMVLIIIKINEEFCIVNPN